PAVRKGGAGRLEVACRAVALPAAPGWGMAMARLRWAPLALLLPRRGGLGGRCRRRGARRPASSRRAARGRRGNPGERRRRGGHRGGWRRPSLELGRRGWRGGRGRGVLGRRRLEGFRRRRLPG
ncbi:unnamed protein product, partial [Prorocentrum cordatum]